MLFTRRNVARLAALLVLVGIVSASIFLYRHRRLAPTSSYFEPIGRRSLNADERKVMEMLTPMLNADPSDFEAYAGFPVTGWKYSLAFTGYAIANVVAINRDQ